MVEIKDDLKFINWCRTFARKLDKMNSVIVDAQQRQDLDEQEVALYEKLYKLYWSGEVTFDAMNINDSALKVR